MTYDCLAFAIILTVLSGRETWEERNVQVLENKHPKGIIYR